MQKSPLFLLLPLCCTVQFAYILPVANPPNAVVYSYGRFTMMDMVSIPVSIKAFSLVKYRKKSLSSTQITYTQYIFNGYIGEKISKYI